MRSRLTRTQWLKRPIGASFAFGGKLITFSAASKRYRYNLRPLVDDHAHSTVKIVQVQTDSNVVAQAEALRGVMDGSAEVAEQHCQQKVCAKCTASDLCSTNAGCRVEQH